MGRVLALDSSAIIALARGDAVVAALLHEIRIAGGTLVVPAPVLAEVLRGGRSDAGVHRLLNAIDAELPTTPAAARLAGASLGHTKSPSSRTIDALIVETAIEHRVDGLLTSDTTDMRALSASRMAILSIA